MFTICLISNLIILEMEQKFWIVIVKSLGGITCTTSLWALWVVAVAWSECDCLEYKWPPCPVYFNCYEHVSTATSLPYVAGSSDCLVITVNRFSYDLSYACPSQSV